MDDAAERTVCRIKRFACGKDRTFLGVTIAKEECTIRIGTGVKRVG
jgi:hypothetical protein